MGSSDGGQDSGAAVGTALWSLGDLELELVRIRSEARAARLEARAAEIELQARRLRKAGKPAASAVPVMVAPPGDASPDTASANPRAGLEPAPPPVGRSAVRPPPIAPASQRFEVSKGAGQPVRADEAKGSGKKKVAQATKRPADSKGSEHKRGLRQRTGRTDQKQHPVSVKEPLPGSVKGQRPGRVKERAADRKTDSQPTASRRPSQRALQSAVRRGSSSLARPNELALAREHAAVPERRRRPAAWVMSTLAHIGVLALLAALTLSPPPPKDQLAFSATAPRAASEELESVVIEPMQSNEPSEQVPVEDTVEIDPLGDLAAASPVSVQQPAASAPSEATAFSDSLDVSQMLLESDAEVTTEFCGVAGGGNHFCYIVDSSKSMKNGRFDSARAELLRSIDQLKKDQRFYVIFYDTNTDRMCVSDPSQPDAYSVTATLENKRALRQWAMQIGLERGAPPDKALEFAFTLRPDAIFLLSDGEFPQRIEDLVAELNHDENLFGEQKPRSILHTIGYHSRDGEQRMRQLAEANGGQYHYVPGPR